MSAPRTGSRTAGTRKSTSNCFVCGWVDHPSVIVRLPRSQNPSPPLHPTTDKLGFSGCLEQSVVTPNPVVGQSTGVHNQSNDDLFRQMEKCMSFHGDQKPRAGSIQNPVHTKRTPFDIFRPFRGEKRLKLIWGTLPGIVLSCDCAKKAKKRVE